MPGPHARHDHRGLGPPPRLAAASGLLLALCWALGGVTVDSSGADELLQLLALPILLWAAWRLAQASMTRTRALALACAAAIVLVPLWQLLPLPQGVGMGRGRFLQVGDRIRLGVEGLGVQEQAVVAAG